MSKLFETPDGPSVIEMSDQIETLNDQPIEKSVVSFIYGLEPTERERLDLAFDYLRQPLSALRYIEEEKIPEALEIMEKICSQEDAIARNRLALKLDDLI